MGTKGPKLASRVNYKTNTLETNSHGYVALPEDLAITQSWTLSINLPGVLDKNVLTVDWMCNKTIYANGPIIKELSITSRLFLFGIFPHSRFCGGNEVIVFWHHHSSKAIYALPYWIFGAWVYFTIVIMLRVNLFPIPVTRLLTWINFDPSMDK